MLDLPVSDHMHIHLAESGSASTGSASSFSWPDDVVQVGQQTLAALVRPGMRVTLAFTDATRACPDAELVGWLLAELIRLGVAWSDITLLCATGLHRPITEAELLAKLGPELSGRAQVVSHQALEPFELVQVGEVNGLPVVVNRRCLEADLLLATGVVEPHQYAGYSGGAKTVVIGCGGEATIRATHSAALLDQPGTRLGAVEGNPFQEFVRQAGRLIGLDYVVNVLLDESQQIVAAAAGDPMAVHDYLVEKARPLFEVSMSCPAHLALAGVGGPKAVNLYQASRAATYLALAGDMPLLPGAPILLPAPIPEGAGQGKGEQRFYDILARSESPAQLMQDLRQNGFPAGGQRAYVLAQVLVQHPVIVVGAEHPEVVRACHMLTAPDMATGLAMAEDLARAHFNLPVPAPLDFLVVPHALLTLPRLAQG